MQTLASQTCRKHGQITYLLLSQGDWGRPTARLGGIIEGRRPSYYSSRPGRASVYGQHYGLCVREKADGISASLSREEGGVGKLANRDPLESPELL